MKKKYCYGIDIGGTTVKIGLFQVDGMLVDKWEIKTRTINGGEKILSDIAATIQEHMLKKSIKRKNIRGIGVGVPAATKNGFVSIAANLGWICINVKKELEKMLGLPVKVDNDANLAALGEMWQGGGEGMKNLVMVTLGTGIGGGVLIDGEIHTGVCGGGGEIGHLCVEDNEVEICGCGRRGCLEQYASATGIVRLAKRKLAICKEETILQHDLLTAKAIFDAAKQCDSVAVEIVDRFGKYLGDTLSNVAVLLDPEIFVIGGGVSKAGDIVLESIKKFYIEKALPHNRNVKFALAELGNDAGIYGAAKMAFDME